MNFETRQALMRKADWTVAAVDDYLRQRRGVCGLVQVSLTDVAAERGLTYQQVETALKRLHRDNIITWSSPVRLAFVRGHVLDTCDGNGFSRMAIKLAAVGFVDCGAKRAMDRELDATLVRRRQLAKPQLTVINGGAA